jgi:hypothetical protein
MISRGRNGSIIVDSSSQMESTIGQNRVEMTTAPAPKISSYLEEFTKKTLDYINKIVSGET